MFLINCTFSLILATFGILVCDNRMKSGKTYQVSQLIAIPFLKDFDFNIIFIIIYTSLFTHRVLHQTNNIISGNKPAGVSIT